MSNDWIWCQEVISGKYFWVHSSTQIITHSQPPNWSVPSTSLPSQNSHKQSDITITRRHTTQPKLHKQKSSTPPPTSNNTSLQPSHMSHTRVRSKSTRKKRKMLRASASIVSHRSTINYEDDDLDSIDSIDSTNSNRSVKMSRPTESVYNIKVGADIDYILLELLGYDNLNIRQCMLDNEFIKSDINSFLLYRYQSSNISHLKEFTPPLNDRLGEILHFRNIEYPQYPLETNLNIEKIITDIYVDQIPYLRIRIPTHISTDVLGNKNFQNHQKSINKLLGFTEQKSGISAADEIFRIELSAKSLSNSTVQSFFHHLAKRTTGMKDEREIKNLFLGISEDSDEEYDSEEDEYGYDRQDWTKLAIKANGFEEYIFYSTDANDKICNYECVRTALLHQLDKMDQNMCFLTLVNLESLNLKIEMLKNKYMDYTSYVSDWRKSVQNVCFQKQYSTNYPFLNSINKQFSNDCKYINYKQMNADVSEWKKRHDLKYPNNNFILLQDCESFFEYTVHSIVNYDKLPRYNKHKYSSIIISFELQIGSTSYEQDLWFTRPKNLRKHKNKIVFRNAIYKSSHLKLSTFPREIMLSVIVFGIPNDVDDTDIQNVIDSSDKDISTAPAWFLDNYTENIDEEAHCPDLLVKEVPINFPGLDRNSLAGISRLAVEDMKSNEYKTGDDMANVHGNSVFYNAFKTCDALGYVRFPLIDDFHTYRDGVLTFNLWDIPYWEKPTKHEPRDRYGHDLFWRFVQPGSFPPNVHRNKHNQCQITIRIGQNPENDPNYLPPTVIAPLFNAVMSDGTKMTQIVGKPKGKSSFTTAEIKKMGRIVRKDPLSVLTKDEKYLIWISREFLCKTKPRALPVFLSCVDWKNPYFRSEGYKYLMKWKLSNVTGDLTDLLISWTFPDNRIKHFVVHKCLNPLNDIQINQILLQLVQVIKLEPHNFSLMSNFLIQRALRSVTRIGHYLYWFLKSEIDHSYRNYTRFSLILEDFLIHCFAYPSKLYVQKRIVSGLSAVSSTIQKLKKRNESKPGIIVRMQQGLKRINLSISKFKGGIPIPLNPKYKLTKLRVEKCRFMGSAQAPLWLEFENYDSLATDTTKILFKTGDDLRQDLLTLNIMNSMNQFWLASGHYMRFRIYYVITTSAKSGFIEIVTHSQTFNSLSENYGKGTGLSRGVQDKTTHVQYIKDKHKLKKHRLYAQKRYLQSCAGYCIASWIIGVGDRHSDNIMVHECGDLFHIDFGHFLGHFKVEEFKITKRIKFDWLRERSPFVFLPAMKYCIKYNFLKNSDNKNGNYEKFISLCTTAMHAIRQKQRLLINLFILMLPSQMPELLSKADIIYMKKQILLGSGMDESNHKQNSDKVREIVCEQLNSSLNDGVRILDHVAHAWKHK